MKRLYLRLTPSTFKNRILLAFLLLVLTPIAVLVLYNFKETEQMLQDNAETKNMEQLIGIKNGFVDLMSLVMKTGLLLEQDTTILSIMKNPEQSDEITRKKLVESKFGAIENTFFMSGATVYYTLIDLHGNAYTSFMPKDTLSYDEIQSEDWVQALKQEGSNRYIWNPNDRNNVVRESTTSNKMLSLYEVMRDNALNIYAYARLSIDYEEWFTKSALGSRQEGSFFLLDALGRVMLNPNRDETFSPDTAQSIVKSTSQQQTARAASIIDPKEKSLYTYSYIEELNGYVVKKVQLAQLFLEVYKQKQRFFAVFGVILLLFVLLTYFISSTITVPLKKLQKKMEMTAKTNLKMKLPEQGRGEILALTQSFNIMIHDLNELLQRLQLEEKQKQFVRFQVLLSQMNPHFLLNTLNTIKSIALDKDDDEIYEICVALGKILETTLNTEVDLILLKDEIVLIESYMEIQRQRFGHGIEIQYDINEELQYALIPKFCLQPLIENSLIHGFGQSVKQGRIDISAKVTGQQLYLQVKDNGMGIERAQLNKATRKRKGIGVQNIRESLELLFKNQRTGMDIMSSDTGTEVTIHFPLLISKPYDGGKLTCGER